MLFPYKQIMVYNNLVRYHNVLYECYLNNCRASFVGSSNISSVNKTYTFVHEKTTATLNNL